MVAKTRTSSEVKDRYNSKAYDEIKIRVVKGKKESLQTHAHAKSESLNGFINRAIDETIERDNTSQNETTKPTSQPNVQAAQSNLTQLEESKPESKEDAMDRFLRERSEKGLS